LQAIFGASDTEIYCGKDKDKGCTVVFATEWTYITLVCYTMRWRKINILKLISFAFFLDIKTQ
jgi:hypothetical protein